RITGSGLPSARERTRPAYPATTPHPSETRSALGISTQAQRLARPVRAPRRSAPERSARERSAPRRSAPRRSAPRSRAPANVRSRSGSPRRSRPSTSSLTLEHARKARASAAGWSEPCHARPHRSSAVYSSEHMSLSTASAVAAAQSLAREHGLETEPVVLADRSNLVLHLAPHPLVARVAMATSVVRVGMEWLHREVELSRFLHARGAFVTRPNERVDPGPVERDGMIISLWELEDVRGACDPSLVGSRLAHAHRLLAELPEGVVPEWAGWTEARVVLERALT